jgi:hypothetical protein
MKAGRIQRPQVRERCADHGGARENRDRDTNKIQAALKKVGVAQDAMFEMRHELFALQGQNRNLKQEQKQADAWNQKVAAYKLTSAAGGAVVLASTGEPPHFVCPSCVNHRELQIRTANTGSLPGRS